MPTKRVVIEKLQACKSEGSFCRKERQAPSTCPIGISFRREGQGTGARSDRCSEERVVCIDETEGKSVLKVRKGKRVRRKRENNQGRERSKRSVYAILMG